MKGPVLYVTYDGVLEPLGARQIIPYLTLLAKAGLEILLVSFEKPADRGTEAERALRHSLERAGIEWTALAYHAGPALLTTAWDVLRGRGVVSDLVRNRHVALLHARSYVAATMALPAVGEATGLVFDMRGFWIDERLESGRWSRGHPAVGPARRLERRLLDEAHGIIHLSEAARGLVGRLAPVRTRHQVVVPTCVDMDAFVPALDSAATRASLGLDGRPLLLHAGTLSGWYLGADTLAAGARFEALGGQFVVLTRELDEVTRLVEGGAVPPTARTVDPDEVPLWMGVADVGLSLVRPTFAKTASMPTRVGEYLSSGMAVAATAGVGDLDTHFSHTEVARAFPAPLEPSEVGEWAHQVASHPGRIDAARGLAASRYDIVEGVERIQALYRELGVVW